MPTERKEGECWWELQARAKKRRLCTRRRVEGFEYPTDMPTGWAVKLGMSGEWVALKYGYIKYATNSMIDAKQFAETTWRLENAS